MTDSLIERTKVFISYSHQDKEWLNRLRVHLRPLERQFGVDVWADTDINPGSRWRSEIEKALASAKVAVLLISADFIASDFVANNELPPLLRAAEDEGAVILPLILSPSMFSRIDDLAQFQAVNDPVRPLVGLTRSEQESVLVELTEAIQDVLGFSPKSQGEEVERASEPLARAAILETQDAPESDTQRSHVMKSPAVWVALIASILTIIAAYWQFVYKPAHAEETTTSYTGRVTDGDTNKPIHNAKVAIEQGQNVPQIQYTDSEGIFHLVLRGSTGGARIRVEATGYAAFDRNVSFSRTGIEPISLTTTPTPTPVPQQPTPRPRAGRQRQPNANCTAEDILLDKC